MERPSRVLTFAAAAVLAGTTGMALAQEAPATGTPPATTGATSAPSVNLNFLAALFAADARPDRDEVSSALAGTDLTLTRLSYASNGDVRLRAVTADGERIRVRIEDGELRYRIQPASDSGDTSDSNGMTSDSNGATTGSSDANGPTSGGRNGDRSGGGDGNGGGSSD